MQVVNYVEANRILEPVKLTDAQRTKVFEFTGRLDEWLQPTARHVRAHPDETDDDLGAWFGKHALGTRLFTAIPECERWMVRYPACASRTSWLRERGIVTTRDILFSPLFARWVESQPLSVSIDVPQCATLTPYESRVLGALVNGCGAPVSRDAIGQAIWGANWYERYSDWTIDTHISHIRRKLPFGWEITIVRGMGYRLQRGMNTVQLPKSHAQIVHMRGIVPHQAYLSYMNDPTKVRKTLHDLFRATAASGLDRSIQKVIGKSPTMLVIHSYSYDNVDALRDWLIRLIPDMSYHVYFSHTDERAYAIHRKRIEDIHASDSFHTIHDDIRETKIVSGSMGLVINDFRLNFNIGNGENIESMKGIHKVLRADGLALVSVVVDVRYDHPRYGENQERAPLHTSSPWTFVSDEGLERQCYPVPYYERLFEKTGFLVVKQFDVEEGKHWMRKLHGNPMQSPSYRRFLLRKIG